MTTSTATHFHLKHRTGWFAAGQEVEQALTLLSDAAFKLFMWLCLHAERRCGSLSASPAELASVLDKTASDIQAALQELFQQGVCNAASAGVIEIADRFWPYQNDGDSSPAEDLAAYIAQVKRCFLERRCVQSTFTPADEKLAAQLYRKGVSVVEVQRAILLGSLRKYDALASHGGTPITSLYYFTALFEEVRQNIPAGYFAYVAHHVRKSEQNWNGFQAQQKTK